MIKKSGILALTILLFSVAQGQTSTSPYPIIFVHGLISDASAWDITVGVLGGMPKVYDICLNDDGGNNFTATLPGDLSSGAWRDNANLPSPTRLYEINFDASRIPGHQSHHLSNQAAITKQAAALKQMINAVIALEGCKKVILVGHSMGGLAIREYLQRTNDGTPSGLHTWWVDPKDRTNGHKVAKVVTIGTPHGGCNSSLGLLDWFVVDPSSEAVRDLRYEYTALSVQGVPLITFNAPYLYGGDESALSRWNLGYYNTDINCNGISDSKIAGLNLMPLSGSGLQDGNMPLPVGIFYTWITSKWTLTGDGIVDLDRQWLHYNDGGRDIPIPLLHADSIVTNYPHAGTLGTLGETDDFNSILRGLDEPAQPSLAYEIPSGQRVRGYITCQQNMDDRDIDCFKFSNTQSGILRVVIDGLASGIHGLTILDGNNTPINSFSRDISGELPATLYAQVVPGTYYIKVNGTATNATPPYPYSLTATVLPPDECPNRAGDNAPTPEIQQAFIDAYNRNGGMNGAGVPKCTPDGLVHLWNAIYTQDFSGGSGLYGDMFYNANTTSAFYVHAAVFTKYLALGAAGNSLLGAPTSDEVDAPSSPLNTTGRKTSFTNCVITWVSSGSNYNQTHAVWGGIYQLYSSMGFSASQLGFPISDEYVWQNGARQDFEGGYIFWTESSGAVARFRLNLLVNDATKGSINVSPSSVDGAGYFSDGTVVKITAVATSGNQFSYWSGKASGAVSPVHMTIDRNSEVKANFSTNEATYAISCSANPSNAGGTSGCGTYVGGQLMVVHATPNAGWSFAGWSENGITVSNTPDYSFVASGSRNLVASFSQQTQQYSITCSPVPSGGGSTSGAGTFFLNQSITIQAAAASGWSFHNWTENGLEVSQISNYHFTVTGNRNLNANFLQQAQSYSVTCSASPSNGGGVIGGGTYTSGQTVNVYASPENGWNFLNWTENGGVVSSTPKYTFVALSRRNLVANFSQIQNFYVACIGYPLEGGTTLGGGDANLGQQLTITAIPNPGWKFLNWTESGTEVSTNADYSFIVRENRSFAAHFLRIEYPIVTALSASSVSWFSAQLNGQYESNGPFDSYYCFEWGPTSAYGSRSGPSGPKYAQTPVQVQYSMVGLAASTLYHYRIIVWNGVDTSYGDDMMFTTMSPPPTVATLLSISASDSALILNARVNPNGLATVCWFEYDTSVTFSSAETTPIQSVGSGVQDQNVSYLLSSLPVSTTIYFRAVAANISGSATGSVMSRSTGTDTLHFWEPTNGPNSVTVFALTIGSDRTLYSAGVGVYASTDVGKTWQSAGLANTAVDCLGWTITGDLIAGGRNKLYRSTDRGSTWGVMFDHATNVYFNSVIGRTNGDILTGSSPEGVFKSTDSGVSWTQCNGGLSNLYVHAMIQSGSGDIFLGTSGGLFRSTTGGSSWSMLNLGGASTLIMALAVDSHGRILAGTGSGVYGSIDNGASWSGLTDGFHTGTVNAIVVDSLNRYYLGLPGGGVYQSVDEGLNWSQVNDGLFNPNVNALAAGVDETILAGTSGGIVFRTNSHPVDANCHSIVVRLSPGNGGTVLIIDSSNCSGGYSTGTLLRVKAKANPGYTFSYWSCGGGTIGDVTADSSALTVTGNSILIANFITPLPIQLLTFTGHLISENAVELKWSSETESNNYGFFVERRRDTLHPFVSLAASFIEGSGTTLEPHEYSWIDSGITSGTYYYRLKQVDLTGGFAYSEAIAVVVNSTLGTSQRLEYPKEFRLETNFPNPFNPLTKIRFAVPARAVIDLKVFNVLGQMISSIARGVVEAGYLEFGWDASKVPSGLYFYHLDATSISDPTKHFSQTRKMLLVK